MSYTNDPVSILRNEQKPRSGSGIAVVDWMYWGLDLSTKVQYWFTEIEPGVCEVVYETNLRVPPDFSGYVKESICELYDFKGLIIREINKL